ncbi:MAG: hypothetical protein EPN26_12000, partial [Rhodospirillales bacterium]
MLVAILFLSGQPGAPPGLRIWAVAIGFNVLRMLSFFLVPLMGKTPSMLMAEGFHAGFVLLLLTATWTFLGRKPHRPALLALGAFFSIWLFGSVATGLSFLATTLPFYFVASLVHFYMGWTFFTYSSEKKLWGGRSVGVLIALWGVHKLNYPWLRPIEAFAPFGFMTAELLALSISVGLLMMAQ